MKCGILTYHQIPNFGAVLQAYSLCAEIQKLGYECDIIDYQCSNIIKRELIPPRYSNPIKALAYRIFIEPHQKKKIQECRKFAQNFYSKHKYTRDNICEANKEYDLFISGSDMIWNLNINGGDTSFFLDFTETGKGRISYGSSVGGNWTEEQQDKLQSYLKQYDYISVREKDTCKVITEKLGISCSTVCDPTMLLNAAEWDKFTKPVEERGYVLVYFPYKEILAAASRYAEEKHKKLIILGTVYPWKAHHYKSVYSPQEWMSYIKYADAVFTDSYHGLLFSLYFNRPVWTNNRNNRLANLLDELHLKNCYIENDRDFQNQIDFESCNKSIERKRKNSLQYLHGALERGKQNAY